jgi:hypothetical protein
VCCDKTEKESLCIITKVLCLTFIDCSSSLEATIARALLLDLLLLLVAVDWRAVKEDAAAAVG